MISKTEWTGIYNRIRIIEHLIKCGGGSKSMMIRGAGVAYDTGYSLIREMEIEGMITLKPVARSEWVTLNQKGKLLYDEYKKLVGMII